MVGPISSEERASTVRRVKLVLVLIVGASGGLISLQADASLPWSVAAVAVGLLVGALLVWFVFPGDWDFTSSERRGPPRR